MLIDEKNFSEYFFDARQHTPKKGQILARYTAIAEFIDGRMKQDVIDLLLKKGKAEAATRVMRKLGCATEVDSFRIPKEMARDLLTMTPEEVEKKPYKYTMEAFYYTEKENVPLDPHWTIISLVNLDEFLDAGNNKVKITSKRLNIEQKENDER